MSLIICNSNAQTRIVVYGKIINAPEEKNVSVGQYKNFISYEKDNINGTIDKNGNFKVILLPEQSDSNAPRPSSEKISIDKILLAIEK